MNKITKIAAVILKDGKTLVVRAKGRDAFISLGGKLEKDETHEECLKREIKEETGASTGNIVFFGNFTDKSIFDERIIDLHAYLVDVTGEMKPQAEIEELKWISSDYKEQGIRVGSILEKFIIPKLVKEKMMR